MSPSFLPVPEDGAVVHVHMLLVEFLQAEVVDFVVVSAIGGREYSRLHLAFDLGVGDDVHERRLSGRQVEFVGVIQLESRRRRTLRQEIDRLIGEQQRVARRHLVDLGRLPFVFSPVQVSPFL